MKKILFTAGLVLAGIASSVQAQTKLHLGLTSAYSSTFVLDEGLSKDPRYQAKPTYNFAPIGFTAGVDFGHGFGLQLESILSKQGQVFEIIDIAKQVIGQRRIDLDYVHLPLLLRSFGTGGARTRFNFMFGPQFSFLTRGQEVYEQYQAGTLQLPEGSQTPTDPNTGKPVTVSSDGTYNYPATTQTLFSTEAKNVVEQYKKMDLQLALGMGVDIDLGKNLYLSTQIRGNYGFVDMRNEDLLNELKEKTTKQAVSDLFGRRANLLVGVQVGLHWMFGGNRSSIGGNAGVPSR
jgi:hypothetical protein